MIIEIFRNMWRRKLRSILTILGITIGIFAFTVMGSMAVRFNYMIGGAKDYATGQITISPKGSAASYGMSGATLPVDVMNGIREIEGVESVSAMIELMVNDMSEDMSMSFGIPEMIEANSLSDGFRNRNWDTLLMKEGRLLGADDGDHDVMIGYDIAKKFDAGVGDKITVRGEEFNVVGVIDQTLTGPDKFIFMDIPLARKLLIESNPFLKSLKEQADQAKEIDDAELRRLSAASRAKIEESRSFKEEEIATGASVSWKDGADPEEVVEKIKEKYGDDVLVYSPQKLGEQIDQASAAFNSRL